MMNFFSAKVTVLLAIVANRRTYVLHLYSRFLIRLELCMNCRLTEMLCRQAIEIHFNKISKVELHFRFNFRR